MLNIDNLSYGYKSCWTSIVEAIYHPDGDRLVLCDSIKMKPTIWLHKKGNATNWIASSVWNGSTWRYEFNVTDHLGNVRAVISDIDNNKIIKISTDQTLNEIINVNSYYPFGLVMGGTFSNNTTTIDTRYQYNGKEMNSDLGLNLLDYGARWYDASIGRFISLDPLATKYNSFNSYNYTLNNPILLIDPDGRYVVDPSDQSLSKILTTFLKCGLKDLVKNSEVLINGLMKYGQFKTKEDLFKVLESNSGPKLSISNQIAFDAYGYYTGGTNGTIQINAKLVERLNNATADDQQAALLDVVSTILHETVHFGDWQDGNPEDNQDVMEVEKLIAGKIYKAYKMVGDKGHAFENEVYFDGDDKNTVNSIEKAKKVIADPKKQLLIPSISIKLTNK